MIPFQHLMYYQYLHHNTRLDNVDIFLLFSYHYDHKTNLGFLSELIQALEGH